MEQTRTEAEISASVIDFGSFHWEEKKDTTVTLVNKGKKPLVIHDVATSCGCTVADYDKPPARPVDSISVKFSFKADHPGYFSKTIGIYCNTPQSLFKVRVRGNPDWDKVLLMPVVLQYETTGNYNQTMTGIQNDLKPSYAKLLGGPKGTNLDIEVTYTIFDEAQKIAAKDYSNYKEDIPQHIRERMNLKK